jgi:endonuclease G
MAPHNRVVVPSHFYKIIMHERPNGYIETMTFLLPHVDSSPTGRKKADKYLTDHLVTIDEIEALTGIDFLCGVREDSAQKETAIEAFKANRMWPRE